jgi:hypothetical protein
LQIVMEKKKWINNQVSRHKEEPSTWYSQLVWTVVLQRHKRQNLERWVFYADLVKALSTTPREALFALLWRCSLSNIIWLYDHARIKVQDGNEKQARSNIFSMFDAALFWSRDPITKQLPPKPCSNDSCFQRSSAFKDKSNVLSTTQETLSWRTYFATGHYRFYEEK